MKKICFLALSLLVAIGLTGCGSNDLELTPEKEVYEADLFGATVIKGSVEGDGNLLIDGEKAISQPVSDDFSIVHKIEDPTKDQKIELTYQDEDDKENKVTKTVTIKANPERVKQAAAYEKSKKEKEEKKAAKAAEKQTQEAEDAQKAADIETMKPDLINSLDKLIAESNGVLIRVDPNQEDYSVVKVYVAQDTKYRDEGTKEAVMDKYGREVQNRINGYLALEHPAYLTFYYSDTQEELGTSKLLDPTTFKLKDK